jgi:hypothetical protein
MEIPNHEIRVRSSFGPIKAKVTSAAIKALRHESSRSLPAYVIAERREMIERSQSVNSKQPSSTWMGS